MHNASSKMKKKTNNSFDIVRNPGGNRRLIGVANYSWLLRFSLLHPGCSCPRYKLQNMSSVLCVHVWLEVTKASDSIFLPILDFIKFSGWVVFYVFTYEKSRALIWWYIVHALLNQWTVACQVYVLWFEAYKNPFHCPLKCNWDNQAWLQQPWFFSSDACNRWLLSPPCMCLSLVLLYYQNLQLRCNRTSYPAATWG